MEHTHRPVGGRERYTKKRVSCNPWIYTQSKNHTHSQTSARAVLPAIGDHTAAGCPSWGGWWAVYGYCRICWFQLAPLDPSTVQEPEVVCHRGREPSRGGSVAFTYAQCSYSWGVCVLCMRMPYKEQTRTACMRRALVVVVVCTHTNTSACNSCVCSVTFYAGQKPCAFGSVDCAFESVKCVYMRACGAVGGSHYVREYICSICQHGWCESANQWSCTQKAHMDVSARSCARALMGVTSRSLSKSASAHSRGLSTLLVPLAPATDMK